VRREVEVVHGRSHGWIDLLAFHPEHGILVIVEIKTRVEDLGLIERQLAWYERSAHDVASRFGWRPARVVSWLLLLATDEVEHSLRRERDAIREGFPVRASEMRAVLQGTMPTADQRGLALIDPSSRRAAWLIPSRLDGRRSPPPHRDYADAARRMTPDLETLSPAATCRSGRRSSSEPAPAGAQITLDGRLVHRSRVAVGIRSARATCR
jgi:hypothetical protein